MNSRTSQPREMKKKKQQNVEIERMERAQDQNRSTKQNYQKLKTDEHFKEKKKFTQKKKNKNINQKL